MLKQLIFEWELGKEVVYLSISQYGNGNIYVGLAPNFCDITVNLCYLDEPYTGYIDVNNVKELPEFLRKYGIAEDTGKTMQSGFVTYPLYKFNREKLREYNSNELRIYEEG